MSNDLELASELVLKQEEMLQFDHFTNRDAWELGKLIVEELDRGKIEMAVCIRKLNGYILFQYATEKTSMNNQHWMQRKFNMVSRTERSSMGATVDAKLKNEDLSTHGLSASEYVFCGGGFPVRLKSGSIAAVVTVSNLPSEQDHGFVVRCLAKYLKVEGVPEMTQTI